MTDETDAPACPAARRNPDLVGHEAAEAALRAAFDSGRLPHAWLIAGPRGIGKATLAFRFARYVLAHGQGTAAAGGLFGGSGAAGPETAGLHLDPQHPVFRRVASGGHADLLTVEPAYDEKRDRRRDEIVVGDVRDIGAFLSLSAAEGGWRVVVIDAADEMNRNAANAVLKVLEEPPPRALLLLVSHNPGSLLPTIRSRCQKLALRPLADAAVADLVSRWCPDTGPGDAHELARLADGSPGRALALADADGLALYRELRSLLDRLPELDGQALHRFGEKLGRAGQEGAFRTASDLLYRWLSGLIVVAAGGAPSGRVDAPATAAIAGPASLDRWLAVWEKTTRLLARVESANLDRKLVFLDLFLSARNAATRA